MNPTAAQCALEVVNRSRAGRFPHASPATPVAAHVFDMDGTLADVSEMARVHLDLRMAAGLRKDFDAFHAASIDAPPNRWVLDALLDSYAADIPVLVVTARMLDHLDVTNRWLERHRAPFDRLYMRAQHDYRPDREVKADIHAQILADGFTVAHAWDDNPTILALWTSLGIPTTAVQSNMYTQPGEPA